MIEFRPGPFTNVNGVAYRRCRCGYFYDPNVIRDWQQKTTPALMNIPSDDAASDPRGDAIDRPMLSPKPRSLGPKALFDAFVVFVLTWRT